MIHLGHIKYVNHVIAKEVEEAEAAAEGWTLKEVRGLQTARWKAALALRCVSVLLLLCAARLNHIQMKQEFIVTKPAINW